MGNIIDKSYKFYCEESHDIKDRAIIFLDHANIFHSIKDFHIHKVRIDYKKFKKIVAQGYHLVGAIAYLGIPQIATSKEAQKKIRFIKYLKSAGFIPNISRLRVFPDGSTKQKLIDILIHKEMTLLAEEDAYDIAILMSGDSDFIFAVESIQEMGKIVEILSWEESLSNKMINVAGTDHIHYIDDIFDEIIR